MYHVSEIIFVSPCDFCFACQDDDSDLDYELEALPPVSSEASTEAAACVKVCQTNCLIMSSLVLKDILNIFFYKK